MKLSYRIDPRLEAQMRVEIHGDRAWQRLIDAALIAICCALAAYAVGQNVAPICWWWA
jgi:hypothetical protein